MAVDAFIKFTSASGSPTATPIGESLDKVFKGYFAVRDFSFGATNVATNVATIGTATTGAGGGKLTFNEFTIRKTTDAGSLNFYKNCAAGQHYSVVTLAIRKAGDAGTSGKPFLVYNFGNVFTTKIEWGGLGDDGLEEQLTFVYAALSMAYAAQRADGTLEPLKRADWNQATNNSTFPGDPVVIF